MELPSLDKRCSQQDCQQLDFLPLECKCKLLFCAKHFTLHKEVCPLRKDVVTEDKKKIEEVFKCSEPGCGNTSLVALICEKCKKHFCVNHRHVVGCAPPDPETVAAEREKYAAPVRQFNQIKSVIDEKIESKLSSAKKSKHSATANKIQLMRLKNKATGSKTIPTSDRIYFNIQRKDKNEFTAVFVSKTWSLGRAIDGIATEVKLQNHNNKAGALKLRLFKKEDFSILSKELSQTLEQLLKSGDIIDGDNLILEYVNDDCVSLNGNE